MVQFLRRVLYDFEMGLMYLPKLEIARGQIVQSVQMRDVATARPDSGCDASGH